MFLVSFFCSFVSCLVSLVPRLAVVSLAAFFFTDSGLKRERKQTKLSHRDIECILLFCFVLSFP